jgi:hypothetical protein
MGGSGTRSAATAGAHARTRVAVALVSVALSVLMLSIGPADAHLMRNDSVDDGRICWGGQTRYDGARGFAVRQWNALGAVRIRRDGEGCPRNLVFDDYREPSSALRAYWQPRQGSDRIAFNTYHLEQSATRGKRSTATHEVGHALGLDHSFRPNVMGVPCCQRAIRPQGHDRSDYRRRWR